MEESRPLRRNAYLFARWPRFRNAQNKPARRLLAGPPARLAWRTRVAKIREVRLPVICKMPRLLSQIALLVPILLFATPRMSAQEVRRLRVTPNHRYLQYENGKPFFYLGDTAWELFHKLNREEASEYLTNRAKKGFTVIQASILSGMDGPSAPNAYSETPFLNGDPTKPNEAYFQHVDFVVNKATELGLFIGMLPSWGSHWAPGTGILNIRNARQYGHFLGARYKDKPLIWILGGDRSI